MKRIHVRTVFRKSLKNYYYAIQNMINNSDLKEQIIDQIAFFLDQKDYKLERNGDICIL